MKKKLLSILLVLSLMLALVPAAFAAEPASGTCGAEGGRQQRHLDAGCFRYANLHRHRRNPRLCVQRAAVALQCRYGRCRRGHYSPRCIYAGRQHSHIGQSAVHAHGR